MSHNPPGWNGEYVTTRQAAAFLRVHPRTVQRYARDGLLPSFRAGNRFRFRREDVEAFLVPDGDGWSGGGPWTEEPTPDQ